MSDGARWRDALDRYEAGLAHHETTLATGDPAPGVAPWPPPHLPTGPLPAELQPRAEELLARATDLGRRLTEARDSLPPLPAGHRSAGRPAAPAAGAGRFDRAL